MDEVDSKTQKEVESRLQEALAEFRAQHELQTQIYREELETLYESKVSSNSTIYGSFTVPDIIYILEIWT